MHVPKTSRAPVSTFFLLLAGLLPGVLLAGPLVAAPSEEGTTIGHADPATVSSGTVELPRGVYDRLVAQSQLPPRVPRGAPVGWAPGTATVTVEVDGDGAATVNAQLQVQVLEDEWTLVPLLPLGTAVESARVGGRNEQEVTLVSEGGALSWGVRQAGRYQLSFTYRAEARTSDDGRSLALPLPRASSVKLSGTLPGTGHDVAVIPAAGLRVGVRGGRTWFETTLPSADGVLVAWRLPGKKSHVVSRADYRGSLDAAGSSRGAVQWTGTYAVEIFDDGAVTLPLLPQSVTLSQLEIDGVEAPILVQDGRFATVVRGRGRHVVRVGFETAVEGGEGPPEVHLRIPSVPVSRFELRLPGRKEVAMTPGSTVDSTVSGAASGETTIAVAHAPLTESVTLRWTEAVPEDVRAETRVDVGLYHAAWAEEGILVVDALADFDVRRGEISTVTLRVPPDVQVDSVQAATDGEGGGAPSAVADWRLLKPRDDGSRDLEIFLDRKIDRRMVVSVKYGLSLPRPASDGETAADAEAVTLPLLAAPGSRRQRGMAALLATRDRTLQPADGEEDDGAGRVGENQLPAFVRQALALPVAHTYKYVDAPPVLRVRAAVPERDAGRFDVQIDTLVSLGEVTLRAQATVDVRVKSGVVEALELSLPAGVQLLSLTGPSVRQHTLSDETADGAGEARSLEVEFTQEMDGQFRLEAAYELILADGESAVGVPILGAPGAEVEQGRLAVEALSAVEVQPAEVEQLTALDIAELPRQLVLRTTHPILHAYKYVHAESPPRLALRVTRHALESVQEAAIDEAEYATLYTRDGLAVTRARFRVRNSREQFLELRLPEESEIWSVSVDGRGAKPARKKDDESDEQGPRYLIQIIHSTRGFPVEVVFQTRVGPIRGLGTVRGVLPRPEILVTRTRWDVYLPDGVDYREPAGNLELVAAASPVDQGRMEQELAADGPEAQSDSLQLEVPLRGVHFAFEKLYANQDDRQVGFSIPYASGAGARLAGLGVVVSTLLLWTGLALGVRGRRRAYALVALGLVGLLVLVLRYQASVQGAVVATVLLALAAAGWVAWSRSRRTVEA